MCQLAGIIESLWRTSGAKKSKSIRLLDLSIRNLSYKIGQIYQPCFLQWEKGTSDCSLPSFTIKKKKLIQLSTQTSVAQSGRSKISFQVEPHWLCDLCFFQAVSFPLCVILIIDVLFIPEQSILFAAQIPYLAMKWSRLLPKKMKLPTHPLLPYSWLLIVCVKLITSAKWLNI